ncbi:MAG: 3-mercaptopyruvate sulfurtransferase [Micropepsaceae bacterium]
MGTHPLATTHWLNEHLHDPDIRVLDASWYLPGDARDPQAEYALEHIPSAAFFDIDAIADQTSALPHMMPRADIFAAEVQRLGIGNNHFVIVYDAKGIYSSPRVWWAFKAMGHENCAVLDGGLPKWRREHRPTTSSVPTNPPGTFVPALKPELIRGRGDMLNNLQAHSEQILDARSPSRFAGTEREPRPGVKPGHIPGSVNVYYADLVNDDGTLRSADDLRTIFEKNAIDLSRPIITTCGSGITAAIVFLAANIAGANRLALYDGSWVEWGSTENAPIEIEPGCE